MPVNKIVLKEPKEAKKTKSEIDADDFVNKITNNKVLCYYYWKQCGHCTNFNPIWKKIERKYKGKINMMKIELDVMKHLDQKYAISAFPTIIIWNKGKKYSEFTGMRDEANLSTFIDKNF
jgi:thioredoxin-like negative regulator of GroEL